ncbi:TPA: HdeA/HdeB family chaperone [Providencia alcalifaciens]
MKKIIIPLCFSLFSAGLAFNASAEKNENTVTTPENMTCQEYIDLNPQSLAPVALWAISQKTNFKGGDFVSLSEQSIAEVPLIITYCKSHPYHSLKDYITSDK